jgi:hypothetical protein
MFPLFPLGRIVTTPGALAALKRAKQPAACFVSRRRPMSQRMNTAWLHGFRLLSSYRTDAGDGLWIITEADRSAITLLLPEEY